MTLNFITFKWIHAVSNQSNFWKKITQALPIKTRLISVYYIRTCTGKKNNAYRSFYVKWFNAHNFTYSNFDAIWTTSWTCSKLIGAKY